MDSKNQESKPKIAGIYIFVLVQKINFDVIYNNTLVMFVISKVMEFTKKSKIG